MREIKKLPDSELEVMLALWQSEISVTGVSLAKVLQERRGWSQSTVFTLLLRLLSKGFIKSVKIGKKNWYSAIIDEVSYKHCESKFTINRFYQGSINKFLTQYYSIEDISIDDLNEIQKFIDVKRSKR